MRFKHLILCLSALSALMMCHVALAAEPPAQPSGLTLTPNVVEISLTFHGAQVVVTGEIPKGAQAVLELMGPDKDIHLLRQGRRGGLWMSVGEVTVHDAPSVYMMLTSPNAPAPTADGGWGYKALQTRASFSGAIPKDKADLLFGQFVKLKESEGLYGSFPGTLKIESSGSEHEKFTGSLRLPSNIVPGNYKVTLTVLQNNQPVGNRSADLQVVMTGLPKLLTSLAFEHSGLYGLIAVIVALITGIAVGVVFKGKGGAH